MNKTILSTVAVLGFVATANAGSLEAVRVDWPALAEKTVAVCNGNQVKSAKLQAACKTGQLPNVLKDGTRYHNIGIGTELNVLMANQ